MKRIIVPVLVSLLIALALPYLAQGQQGFKLIVNAANPVDSITKDTANKLFLKKTKTWDNGDAVDPVDLTVSSDVRGRFSEVVLGRDANSIKSFWQRQIFSGRGTAPPEKDSESEVITYVRENRGAIGYVSAGTSVGAGVKVLNLLD